MGVLKCSDTPNKLVKCLLNCRSSSAETFLCFLFISSMFKTTVTLTAKKVLLYHVAPYYKKNEDVNENFETYYV